MLGGRVRCVRHAGRQVRGHAMNMASEGWTAVRAMGSRPTRSKPFRRRCSSMRPRATVVRQQRRNYRRVSSVFQSNFAAPWKPIAQVGHTNDRLVRLLSAPGPRLLRRRCDAWRFHGEPCSGVTAVAAATCRALGVLADHRMELQGAPWLS